MASKRHKRYKSQEILQKLRQAEVLIGQGRTGAEACREIGVTDSHHLHERHGDIPMSVRGGRRRGFLAKPFRDQDMLVRNAVSRLEPLEATGSNDERSRSTTNGTSCLGQDGRSLKLINREA
jgi:hypothetical protein